MSLDGPLPKRQVVVLDPRLVCRDILQNNLVGLRRRLPIGVDDLDLVSQLEVAGILESLAHLCDGSAQLGIGSHPQGCLPFGHLPILEGFLDDTRFSILEGRAHQLVEKLLVDEYPGGALERLLGAFVRRVCWDGPDFNLDYFHIIQ